MSKKKKKAKNGDYLTLSIDGEELGTAMGWNFAPGDSHTVTATFNPTLSNEEYHKYTDMLYEAWSGS